MSSWKKLNDQIVACRKCQRLVGHCRRIASEKRKSYRDHEYWGKPVPNLGRTRIPLLIVGLAPAAHGANRTGRMFTGDRSGDWLYRAMHEAGFCNQATSCNGGDGLRLLRCAITSVCHCAPPDNKPTAAEVLNCQPFLEQTIDLCRPKIFLALGGLAFNTLVTSLSARGWLANPRPGFGHAVEIELQGRGHSKRWLIGSYHPSQQNTFTGRLTRGMLNDVFNRANQLLGWS